MSITKKQKNKKTTTKKIQVDENDCEFILFKTDVYFTEYFLAIEIDETGHTNRDLIFEEKGQKR